jgi:cysteine synthase B
MLARELADADPSLFMPFQYGNAANPLAHERGTAEEILAACPEIDIFVAGLGTGGTLMGCSRRLRRDRPDLLVVAAEPLPGEGIDGLRSLEDGYTPEILDLSLLDRKLLVSNEQSVRGLRALAREEGLFAGVSSGGVLHAAMRIASELDGPANIVMVLADGGWKYLSAGLWDTPEDELAERMEQGIWW